MAKPDGMSMMLRTFGFDPDVIKAQIEDAKARVGAFANHFDARLKSLEDSHAQLIAAINEVMAAQSVLMAQMEAIQVSLNQAPPTLEKMTNGTPGNGSGSCN